MKATDALGLAVELGQVLEAAGLPSAIGGALALGIHGVSRATQDVDCNVFVKPEQLDELLSVLQTNGVQVDVARAREEGTTDSVFFTWAGHTRIDVFLPSIDDEKRLFPDQGEAFVGASSRAARLRRAWATR